MTGHVVWTPEYSVGVAEIDEQHRQFIEIINELVDLSRTPRVSPERLQTDMDRMANYAFYHLSTEEAYFLSCSYAEAKEHTEAHNAYRRTIGDFLDRSRKGKDPAQLAADAAAFSGKWLLDHILAMDKKYTETFHKCGLK